jgi:hypothetical protein
MTTAVKSSALVAASLWVGVLFCLGFILAPYLFALAARHNPVVPNTGVAADLIGPLLDSCDVLGLVVGAGLLLALCFLRRHGEVPLAGRLFLSEAGVALAVLCAAVNTWVFMPRLRGVQAQLVQRYGAFQQADVTDPLFQEFTGLHQTSTTLFAVGFGAALICLVCMTQFRSQSGERPLAPAASRRA